MLRTPRIWSPLIGATWIAIAAGLACGEDVSAEFVEQLRQRGMFDEALDHLDKIEAGENAPERLRESVNYQRGLTLLAAARAQKRPLMRAAQLQQAEAAFRRFLKDHPKHGSAVAAQEELGSSLVERARMHVGEARVADNEGARADSLNQGRKLYEEATGVFGKLEVEIREVLTGVPKALDPLRDREKIQRRDALRATYVKIQLLAASTIYEQASTFTEKAHREAALVKAAAAYGDIYERFRRRLAGLYARLYQARCYRDLRRYDEALQFYNELLEMPDEPAPFRTLRTKVLAQAIDCWIAPTQGKYELAIKKGQAWVDTQRGNEEASPDWFSLRLALAQAYERAATIRETDEAKRKSLRTKAIEHATFAAAAPGERDEAKRLLAALRRGDPLPMPDDPAEFDEAFTLGQAALARVRALQFELLRLEKQLAAAATDAREALRARVTLTQRRLDMNWELARERFGRCIALADDDTPVKQQHQARYFLAYIHYSRGRYGEAIETGLPATVEESSVAQPLGKLVMAAHLQLFSQAKTQAEKRKRAERLLSWIATIKMRWPEGALTVEAKKTEEKLRRWLMGANDGATPIDVGEFVPNDGDKSSTTIDVDANPIDKGDQ